MGKKEYVFKIGYECLNCSDEWEEKYKQGDEIKEGYVWITLNSHKCIGDVSCPHCKTIKCPICGSDRIKILYREPLLGEQGG